MTVTELMEILRDVPGNLEVYLPAEPLVGFTGTFLTPCPCECKPIVMGLDEDEEFGETETALVIAPHGFFDKVPDPKIPLN